MLQMPVEEGCDKPICPGCLWDVRPDDEGMAGVVEQLQLAPHARRGQSAMPRGKDARGEIAVARQVQHWRESRHRRVAVRAGFSVITGSARRAVALLGAAGAANGADGSAAASFRSAAAAWSASAPMIVVIGIASTSTAARSPQDGAAVDVDEHGPGMARRDAGSRARHALRGGADRRDQRVRRTGPAPAATTKGVKGQCGIKVALVESLPDPVFRCRRDAPKVLSGQYHVRNEPRPARDDGRVCRGAAS